MRFFLFRAKPAEAATKRATGCAVSARCARSGRAGNDSPGNRVDRHRRSTASAAGADTDLSDHRGASTFIKRILAQVVDRLQKRPETRPKPCRRTGSTPMTFTVHRQRNVDLHRLNLEGQRVDCGNRHPAQHRFIVEELAAHRLALARAATPDPQPRRTPVIKPIARGSRCSNACRSPDTGAQGRVLDGTDGDFDSVSR